ncbi:unnamed protein product, partial [Porites lobata]
NYTSLHNLAVVNTLQVLPFYDLDDRELSFVIGGAAIYVDKVLKAIPRPDLKIDLPLVESCWVEIDPNNNRKHIMIGNADEDNHKKVILSPGIKLKPLQYKVQLRDCREHRNADLYSELQQQVKMGDFTGNMASTNVSRNPDTLLCTADLLNRPGELLNGRSNVQQQERTVLELEETVSERSTKGEDHWRT